MKIIVGAEISRYRQRVGALDNRMAYVLGLRRLGHDVYLMGDVRADECFDSNYQPVEFEAWEGRRRFEAAAKAYGIWPNCCMIYDGGRATHGISFAEAKRIASEAELLVNVSAKLKTPEIRDRVRCRVYVDLTPAQPQVYQSEYGIDQDFQHHHAFFTVGLNVGTSRCEIPTCGLEWRPLMHPVVLDLWPVHVNNNGGRFTTISKWSGKQTLSFKGQYSGEKSDNWRAFVDLPRKTSQELEIALNVSPGYEADATMLQSNGWILSDPSRLTGLEQYRDYVAGSRAEFSIANNRYVQFRTGWTSDRTARYLASGKPVIVQSTGIESHLPVGKGLLTFTTPEEATAGIEAINSDYPAHCRAARQIADEYFDSDKVFSRMLSAVGL